MSSGDGITPKEQVAHESGSERGGDQFLVQQNEATGPRARNQQHALGREVAEPGGRRFARKCDDGRG